MDAVCCTARSLYICTTYLDVFECVCVCVCSSDLTVRRRHSERLCVCVSPANINQTFNEIKKIRQLSICNAIFAQISSPPRTCAFMCGACVCLYRV